MQKFRQDFPDVILEEDKIFIIDDNIWTSAGMSAGIDLALAMVENDFGQDLARNIARKLVLYHRRGSAQSQFSALLDLDAKPIGYKKHSLTQKRISTAISLLKPLLKLLISAQGNLAVYLEVKQDNPPQKPLSNYALKKRE
ncbi:hypothetical protein PROPEN_02487 [Proteus penneri ATCC 35198]|nr:hypothetical protein PROPEN_02487 [Proteus penneri ATCC 35198]